MNYKKTYRRYAHKHRRKKDFGYSVSHLKIKEVLLKKELIELKKIYFV